jgi:hypothetical protein
VSNLGVLEMCLVHVCAGAGRLGMRCASMGSWTPVKADTTGRRRGRFSLGSLLPCRHGSQVCWMAQAQGLARSAPSCPSHLGHRRIARERDGQVPGSSTHFWVGSMC